MPLHLIKALDNVVDEYGGYRMEFRTRDPRLREALERELEAAREEGGQFLEPIPKPLTPGPSPRKRGEGRRFWDRQLV